MSGAGTRRVLPSPLRMLMRAGVGGEEASSEVGDRERVELEESEGVEGYEERVTVAVSAEVWRVWVAVRAVVVDARELVVEGREPAEEGREVLPLGMAAASWHW